MSEKETPFNLFSSSGKKKPPKIEISAEEPAPVSKAASSSKAKSRAVKPQYDTKTQGMMDQIKEMHDAINAKLEYISRKSGMSHDEIMKLIQGPDADKADLQKMHEDLRAFSEKVWGALGPGIVPIKEKPVKDTATAKDRKSKTLGARRNWLRMP